MLDSNIEQRDVKDWLAEHDAWWNSLSEADQEEIRAKNKAANEEYERKNAGNTLDQIIGEGIAESLGKPDWLYGDLPKLTKQYFDEFVSIVGEENLQWLTYAQYPANFGKWNNPEELYRGQYLLSPKGQMRAKEHARNL